MGEKACPGLCLGSDGFVRFRPRRPGVLGAPPGLHGPDRAAAADTADLVLTLSDSRDPVNAGEHFKYTVRIENKGPNTAVNVATEASLVAGVTVVAYPEAPCDLTGQILTCQAASLAAAGEVKDEIEVVDNTPGNIGGSAHVSSDTTEVTPIDNEDVESTVVLPAGQATEADLSIVKTDSKDPVEFFEPFTYTVRVDNAGPQTAAHVGVSDFLPVGLGVVSADPGCNFVEGQMYCELGDIASGDFGSPTSSYRRNRARKGRSRTTRRSTRPVTPTPTPPTTKPPRRRRSWARRHPRPTSRSA